MAKAKEQPQEVEIVIFAEAEAMTQKASADLVATTVGTREHLEQLKATYGELVVSGIEDMAGYKVVVEGISKLRNIRTGIEKRRKELTEPALKFQRDLKAVADEITAEIVPLEERLKQEKSRIDDAKEAARRAEFQRRVTLLTENAWVLAGGFYVCGALQIHPDQISIMEEQQLDFYVSEGQKEIQRRQAEAKRKAEEEQQRKAEEERLRKEREELEKEKAEFLAWKAQQQAELNAQKEGIEKAYDTVVQPAETLPIQDQGIRLQERSGILLDLGFVRGADGFAFKDLHSITFKSLMEINDATFNDFVALVEASGQNETVAQTVAAAIPVQQAETAPKTYSPAYMMGFDNFRIQLIELLSSPEKYTRPYIIDWAKNLNPRN